VPFGTRKRATKFWSILSMVAGPCFVGVAQSLRGLIVVVHFFFIPASTTHN
jgi:hypothetical protein